MGDGAGGGGDRVDREGVAGGFVGVGVVAEELGVGQGQRSAFGDGERPVVDRSRGGVDGDGDGGGVGAGGSGGVLGAVNEPGRAGVGGRGGVGDGFGGGVVGDGAGGGGDRVDRQGVAGGFVGVGVVADELGVGQGQRAAFGDGEGPVVDRGRCGVGGGAGDSAGGGCNHLTRAHGSRCGRGCPGPAELASSCRQHRPGHG